MFMREPMIEWTQFAKIIKLSPMRVKKKPFNMVELVAIELRLLQSMIWLGNARII
jgi:hypothetical protein